MGHQSTTACSRSTGDVSVGGAARETETKLPPLFPGGGGGLCTPSASLHPRRGSCPLHLGDSFVSKHERESTRAGSFSTVEGANGSTGQNERLRKITTFPSAVAARSDARQLQSNQQQPHSLQEREPLPPQKMSLDRANITITPQSPKLNTKLNGTPTTNGRIRVLRAEQTSPLQNLSSVKSCKQTPFSVFDYVSEKNVNRPEVDGRSGDILFPLKNNSLREFSAHAEDALRNDASSDVSPEPLLEKKRDGSRHSFKLTRLHTPPSQFVDRASSFSRVKGRVRSYSPNISLFDNVDDDGKNEEKVGVVGGAERATKRPPPLPDLQHLGDANNAGALKMLPLLPHQKTLTETEKLTAAVIASVETKCTGGKTSHASAAAPTLPEELQGVFVNVGSGEGGVQQDQLRGSWAKVSQAAKLGEDAKSITLSSASLDPTEAFLLVAQEVSSHEMTMNKQYSGDLSEVAQNESHKILHLFIENEGSHGRETSIESSTYSQCSEERGCSKHISLATSMHSDRHTGIPQRITESNGVTSSSSEATGSAEVVVVIPPKPLIPLSTLPSNNPSFSAVAGCVGEQALEPAVRRTSPTRAAQGAVGATGVHAGLGLNEVHVSTNTGINNSPSSVLYASIDIASDSNAINVCLQDNRTNCVDKMSSVYDEYGSSSDKEENDGPLEGFHPPAFKNSAFRRSENNIVFILTSQDSFSSSESFSSKSACGTDDRGKDSQRHFVRPRVVRSATTPLFKPHHNTLMRRHVTPTTPQRSGNRIMTESEWDRLESKRSPVWRHSCVHVDSGTGLEISRIYRPTSTKYAPDPTRIHRPAANTFGLHKCGEDATMETQKGDDNKLWFDDDDDDEEEEEEDEEEEYEEEEEDEEEEYEEEEDDKEMGSGTCHNMNGI